LYTDGGHGHRYISVFGPRAMLATLKHNAGGHGISFVEVQCAAVSGDGRAGASIGHQQTDPLRRACMGWKLRGINSMNTRLTHRVQTGQNAVCRSAKPVFVGCLRASRYKFLILLEQPVALAIVQLVISRKLLFTNLFMRRDSGFLSSGVDSTILVVGLPYGSSFSIRSSSCATEESTTFSRNASPPVR
jgi:hypothetical protein